MTQERRQGDQQQVVGGTEMGRDLSNDPPPMFTRTRTRSVAVTLIVEDLSPTGLGYLLSVINESAARVGVVRHVSTAAIKEEPEAVRQEARAKKQPSASRPPRRPVVRSKKAGRR